jgi:RND family efflux transporter MFP subunit
MSWWKQAVFVLCLCGAALVLWARFVPSSHEMLDRIGALQPMRAIGLVPAAPPAAEDAGAEGARRGGTPQVVAGPVDERLWLEQVLAVGTARGIRSATVATEVTGRIEALMAESGEFVEEGRELVRLHSEDARVALDRAKLVQADASRSFERMSRLRAAGSATELQEQEAELAVRSADLALQQAELDLDRHRLVAPFSGWVGILGVEAGDLVAAGTVITTLEDRSTLLVDFRVPERLASRLAPGDAIVASLLADPSVVFEGEVSALDNRVDEASRTLLVQARIPNTDDRLRPGMAVSLTLSLEGGRYPSVDPLAVQWRSDGAFVWVIRNGEATRVPIRILQREAEAVLVEAEFLPGDLVVTEGVAGLRQGGTAEVIRLESQRDGAADAAAGTGRPKG